MAVTLTTPNTMLGVLQPKTAAARLITNIAVVVLSTLVLAAWAPASDVTFMTAGQGNPADVHLANGVGWYYNTQWSWGFVQGGDVPQNNSCDVANGNSQFRMCWHASGGNLSGGYRCGATTGLNGDRTWDRIIFTIP